MNLLILGHCYEPGKHDKIWGLVQEGDGALSFWGRRGGSLSFKRYLAKSQAMETWRTKAKKYDMVVTEHWSRLLPEDFDGQVLLAKLGQIKFE
ncbi:MAG: hypothetical protein ACK5S6_00690 [bacterium]